MTRITIRLYQSKEDFRIMLGLTEKFYPSVQVRDRPAGVDIEENLDASEFRSNVKGGLRMAVPSAGARNASAKPLLKVKPPAFMV